MKFSVCLATGYEGLAYPVNFCEPQDLVRMAQLCEQLGYDSVWGNDHITAPHYVREHFADPPNFYDVLITLAMIAQATTRLRVGTALLVMPTREPVYLAKQVSTIDQMSGGRFILAVGLGAYREEFEAWVGNRFPGARRGDMLEEGLTAFRSLITEKVASFDGKYYSFKNVEMFPKPKQNPFPLFIGGHNMAAVERAATIGHGWLPGWRPFHEIAERIKVLRNAGTGARPRPERDRGRAAVLSVGRQDQREGGRDLHEERAGRAPRVARPYRPRSGASGDRQPGRLAGEHHRTDPAIEGDGRRPLLGHGGRGEQQGRVHRATAVVRRGGHAARVTRVGVMAAIRRDRPLILGPEKIADPVARL